MKIQKNIFFGGGSGRGGSKAGGQVGVGLVGGQGECERNVGGRG